MTILLAASCNDSQNARDKHVAALALGTEATLAPQDSRAQSAFGRIVGRFDPFHSQKGPECWPQMQQVIAKCPDFVEGQSVTFFQRLAQLGLDRLHGCLQGGPIQFTVFEAVPNGKQVIDLRQGFLAPGGHRVRQFAEGHPIAFQVGPANLATLNRQCQVSFETIGGHDALKRLAQQLFERCGAALRRHHEDCSGYADHHPQPASFSALFPACFVNIAVMRRRRDSLALGVGCRQSLAEHLAQVNNSPYLLPFNFASVRQIGFQSCLALWTDHRLVLDNFIDFAHRQQLAFMAFVARLPSALAPTDRTLGTSGRVRRIARWRA
jgi:hypothetical protein